VHLCTSFSSDVDWSLWSVSTDMCSRHGIEARYRARQEILEGEPSPTHDNMQTQTINFPPIFFIFRVFMGGRGTVTRRANDRHHATWVLTLKCPFSWNLKRRRACCILGSFFVYLCNSITIFECLYERSTGMEIDTSWYRGKESP
jgi:hypothetical protein